MTCAHHYVLEAPNGPTTTGVCRHCGQTREYRNAGDGEWGIANMRDMQRTCPECGQKLRVNNMVRHRSARHGVAVAS